MDHENQFEIAEDGPPMIPAAEIGHMLYPWAVQLILEVPPANDTGPVRT